MTYYTCKCPHCRNIVKRAKGRPDDIGNPMRRCPWCGGFYLDAFTEEWVMKSPWKRFKFFVTIPFVCAFLTFMTCMLLNFIDTCMFIVSLIIGAIFSIIAFVFSFFFRKEKIDEEIKKSLQRTKNAKYVKNLLMAGVKIYRIEGVDIGTEYSDEDEDAQHALKDIKKAKKYGIGF